MSMADTEIRLADQVANGTMSQEIADLLRDTARAHKSFLVMAVPRLAGKTTTMRAMLAEQSTPVLALGYDGEDVDPLIDRAKGGYLIVPEIARGRWSAGYVWGEPVTTKAAAVGTIVTEAPDRDVARRDAGHETGDHVADGIFAVAETGSVAVAWPREERGQALLADRLWLLVPASEIVATLDEA